MKENTKNQTSRNIMLINLNKCIKETQKYVNFQTYSHSTYKHYPVRKRAKQSRIMMYKGLFIDEDDWALVTTMFN